MEALQEAFARTPDGIERTVVAGSLHGVTRLVCEVSNLDLVPLSHQWWMHYLRGTRPIGTQSEPIRTVDLFCGSGGLSHGAAQAIVACGRRHAPLAAVDVDAEALQVYARNFAVPAALAVNAASLVDYHVYGQGDEAELAFPPELIDGRLQALVGKVDLVLAGPPCQGHSNLNNHTRRSDPRNALYVGVAATAIALRAPMLVVENVPEVLADKTAVVAAAVRILRDEGYSVSHGMLEATKLGGPQSRKRHFLVATKAAVPHVDLATASAALAHEPMTLRSAVHDLELRDLHSFMDEVPIMSPENRRRVNYLHDNDEYDLPNHQRPDCHKDGHTYRSVYGRMYWDKPAQTVTTGFTTPGRGRYIHPSRRRVITPHEAARLQGFPDFYDFSLAGVAPSRKALTKWIGDAVPCWLGYAAVLTALSSL